MPFSTSGRPTGPRDLRRDPGEDALAATFEAREAQRAAQSDALSAELGTAPEPGLIRLMHQVVDVDHLREAVAQTTTLQVLLEALTEVAEEHGDQVLVRYAGEDLSGRVVAGVASWRGKYADLALDHHELPGEPAPGHHTLRRLIDLLHWADGRTFEGWKGGDFTMGPHTPVWVDNPGEGRRIALTGLSADEGLVLLHVQAVEAGELR